MRRLKSIKKRGGSRLSRGIPRSVLTERRARLSQNGGAERNFGERVLWMDLVKRERKANFRGVIGNYAF